MAYKTVSKTPRKKTKKKSWGTRTVYRGVEYRSNWEVYVAKLLLYSGIAFQFEPQRFYLTPKLSYLPDFYLPEFKAWIEVKGWLLEKDKVRISLFKTKITNRLVYMGKDELEEIFGDSGSKISKLDFETYIPNKEEIVRFQKTIQKSLRG